MYSVFDNETCKSSDGADGSESSNENDHQST
jgi:hypothetical protein